jgi:ABC-type Fe3+/spermidine/putrescine transport system ATPase subunit
MATLTTDTTALLEVRHVSKSFGAASVLHDVSFEIARGEIVCLLGPSGCGKTTLLRIVAGLERMDAGMVRFAGRDLEEIPVHERGFGLMFQDFALFPHKNVFENVAFGLRMAGTDKAQIGQRVGEMLDLVDLAGYGTRRVYELSGGQQQRVALARSLAPSPTLLMLDEPLGSLDRTLREELMGELRRILKRVSWPPGGSSQPIPPARPAVDSRAPGAAPASMAALYVTHDQQEAFAVADRVIILHAGRIEQEGPPLTLYRQPANPFVARFLGMRNLLTGRLEGELEAPEVLVATSLGILRGCRYLAGLREGDAVTVLLRPDAVSLVSTPDKASEAANVLHGQLRSVSFRGSQVKIELGYGVGERLVFELPGSIAGTLPPIGHPLSLALDAQGINVLAAEAFAGGDEGASEQ